MSIADHISGSVADQETVLRSGRRRVVASGTNPSRPATVAALSGRIDESTAEQLADELVDLVFAVPPTDVVLDLRSVDAICADGVETLRNARMAMDDQGVELRVLCPARLVDALAPSGIVLEVG